MVEAEEEYVEQLEILISCFLRPFKVSFISPKKLSGHGAYGFNGTTDIETPSILRNCLLRKAKLFQLPGFCISLNIALFSEAYSHV